MPKEELPRFLPEFLGGVLRRARAEGSDYDLVHTHYWLSGWVGRSAREIWGVPLVASFHTLGKVKNYSLSRGERPEPPDRLSGEELVIADADRLVAATPVEAAQLVGLYRAEPDRIRIVPPGVDHGLFFPRDRSEAKARLHLTDLRLLLFVGRLQAHKGPDVAVRAVAEAIARDPEGTRDVVLAIVGGPSGSDHGAEVARLMDLASALGVGDRVILFPPQPQSRLADFYAAAEAVLVPSRSESFGLVALEAQACATPVVASAVGGLRYVVEDGVTGHLVEGHDPGDHAERILAILGDPRARRRCASPGTRPPPACCRSIASCSGVASPPERHATDVVARSDRRVAAAFRTRTSRSPSKFGAEYFLALPCAATIPSDVSADVRVRDMFLSLFPSRDLPAHMYRDLRVRRVDPLVRRRYISPRSEQPERPNQGTEAGTPGKAVRPTGRTCSYGWDS